MSFPGLNSIPADHTVTIRRPSVNLTNILKMEIDYTRKLMLEELRELIFTYQPGDEKYFIIDNYYDLRFEKRDKNKQWPAKLSKKEVVLCKIEMIRTMLTLGVIAIVSLAEKEGIVGQEYRVMDMLKHELKKIEKDVYKVVPENIDGKGYYKYPGISQKDASFLNEIYKILIKRFQKKS